MTIAATNYDRGHDRHMSADEASSMRERTQWLRRTSWGAILVGAVSAIGLQALFTVLGAAIGVSSYGGQGGDVDGIGTFAGIWWVISGTLSLLVGGMMAGRMITIPRNAELVVHGFTMWAVTAIFGVLFLWSSAGMAGTVGAQSVESASQLQQSNQIQVSNADVLPGSEGQGGSSAAMMAASADEIRSAATAASWWALIALLLGVCAAIGGTYLGASMLGPKDDDDDHAHQPQPRTA